MADERPRVNLAFETHWCTKHLEPFREGWPAGAERAMMALFEAAVYNDDIMAAMPKTTDGKAKTEALNAVLLEHAPLCCFVGEDAMRHIYEMCGKEPPQ